MMQQSTASDYVIASGITHSVRDFVSTSIECAGLPGQVEDYVDFDQDLLRPSEVDLLVGDSQKAQTILGWHPKTSFHELVSLMVENDLKIESNL